MSQPQPDRYFVESPVTSGRALLAGAEAHHLLHVMRAKPGSRVTLFDGSGWEFDAVVEVVRRNEIELTIAGRREIDREAPVAVTLGVTLPKGDRQRWLVEKAVELGVARLAPLQTRHGVAQPVKSALERLRRAVIEASKQCGRNRLMTIDEPQAWSTFVAARPCSARRVVAHPAGGPMPLRRPSPAEEIIAAVGPEGGFTEDEIAESLAAGWLAVNLGPRILRVETAAAALATWAIGFGS